MHTRTLGVLIVLGAGWLLLSGCSDKPAPPAETGARPVKIRRVGFLEAAATREFPGTIRANQTAEMGFEVAGRVTEFLIREGDSVEQGAVLARLDPRDYEAELRVVQANLDKAAADLQRSLTVRERNPNAISTEKIESDQQVEKVVRAQLQIAQKAVDDTELRAPFSGILARKLVEDFANVQAKEPVLILQDNSTLEIEVAIPERDMARRRDQSETNEQLSQRLAPKVIVSALPDREFAASIKEHSTTADPATRTFAVKLNFERPSDVQILPGMTARVRIVVDPDSAWSVPAAAAQADEANQPYVWKVDPESMQVAKTPVELGPLSGDRVLLTGGVAKGDLVAVSGIASLREGMLVRKFE